LNAEPEVVNEQMRDLIENPSATQQKYLLKARRSFGEVYSLLRNGRYKH